MNDIKEKLCQTGKRILTLSRNELYLSMRFLDMALSQLGYEMNLSTKTIGTDGLSILFNPRYLMDAYTAGRINVNRVYMHMLIHNLFCHDFTGRDKNRDCWDLACDIAAESIIDSMDSPAVFVTVSDYREYIYRRLKKEMKVLNAQGIYHYLNENIIPQREFDRMYRAFHRDDHQFWDHDEDQRQQKSRKESYKNWQQISQRTQTNMQTFSKDWGDTAGDLLAALTLEHRECYDYRDFLRHFAVWGEEICPDDDSFDYIFYTYGMDHYKNMPLIEPLEYKDVKKIDEFVIAIDTSQSCPPEVIRDFLEETFSMLSDRENFFKKINIHIVQCDAGVSSDTVITRPGEFKAYMDHFEVKGFGGTDFRPVFDYTRSLMDEGVFQNLKGLIYFTDGYGEFPKTKPPFDTAFVFMGKDYNDRQVPPWAIKLVLTPRDLDNGRETDQ
ncbi:putative metal-dependent peptidase [Catenibacillus scindens]|uniref:Putative metal-dependent peptidase n=1 Tax=Catenibacillus scindens TaxID=673271 RepID=A0A7W8M497_9FIRM|nr:VWA-like domain-containing protein [Catenibacillus scindens]MBB5263619.1 putative metal-dependent peptidase [Catenibacillus scindens]